MEAGTANGRTLGFTQQDTVVTKLVTLDAGNLPAHIADNSRVSTKCVSSGK